MSNNQENKLDKPILIIGGGIAGLSLAQGLKVAGIPCIVFERDPSPNYRAQGYRIRINHFGASGLKSILTPDMWNMFESSCADIEIGMTQMDALTASTIAKTNIDPTLKLIPAGETPLGPYTVDRHTIRKFLLVGLDKSESPNAFVEFNKRFDKFETNGDNLVTAYFKDGTSVQGSFIVGADGVNSVVRKQQYPGLEVVDTTGRCIFGKTPYTPKLLESFPKDGLKNITAIKDGRHLTLFLEPVKWSSNIQEISGGRIPKVDDYVYWVLCACKEVFGSNDEKFLAMNNQEAMDMSLALTETWDAGIRSLLEQQTQSFTSPLPLYSTAPQMQPWESSTVVSFIGDSIHPMLPAGGSGANCAIRDAAALLQVIKQGITKSKIQEYESNMRVYCTQAISASYGGGKMLFNLPPYQNK